MYLTPTTPPSSPLLTLSLDYGWLQASNIFWLVLDDRLTCCMSFEKKNKKTGKSWESLLWRRYVAHVIQQNKFKKRVLKLCEYWCWIEAISRMAMWGLSAGATPHSPWPPAPLSPWTMVGHSQPILY